MAHPEFSLRKTVIKVGLAGVAILGLLACQILGGGNGPIVDPTPGLPRTAEFTPTPTPTPLPHMLPEGPVRLA